MNYYAHPTAIVDEGCEIGEGTKIWHFSHLMTGCKLGAGCNLGQNVFVANGVVLGKNVKVQNNVSLYTGVVCEDDVFLGPSAVLTNVTNPRSAVNRKGEYKQTHIGKGATIGANATIVCGRRIGQYAFIGAGAVVTKDVPPYALILGTPGKVAGWMSEHGHRLHFDSRGRATCPESGQHYFLDKSGVHRVYEGELLAREFAHALDCDDYARAAAQLADDAIYILHHQEIKGAAAIIASYQNQAEAGRKKLDDLTWGRSKVESLDEQSASVLFTDHLRHKGMSHTHQCLQIITTKNGKIVKIEHQELPEEAAKLQVFYKEVGLE